MLRLLVFSALLPSFLLLPLVLVLLETEVVPSYSSRTGLPLPIAHAVTGGTIQNNRRRRTDSIALLHYE
jgi:hypothetical protein